MSDGHGLVTVTRMDEKAVHFPSWLREASGFVVISIWSGPLTGAMFSTWSG